LATTNRIVDFEASHSTCAGLASVISLVRGGCRIEIRPIQPADEDRMVRFHRGLSERSVYMRYFESLSLPVRTAHPRLSRICFVDPARETVLVALSRDAKSGEQEIVGVGRLNKVENTNKAELAVLVLDKSQGCGVGTALVLQLIQVARAQNILHIEAEMLRDNTAMQRVLKKCDFHLRLVDPRTVRAARNL